MDRTKLVELRKQKLATKASQDEARRNQILESNALVKEGLEKLYTLLNEQKPYDGAELVDQIKLLGQSLTFKADLKRVEDAIKALPKTDKVEITNFKSLVDSVDKVKIDNDKAVSKLATAIDELATTVDNNTAPQNNQYPEDFVPMRRVRKVGSQLIFDDDPLKVTVQGGGGGGSSFPSDLIRNGNAIAVVNPDGSDISGGAGGGGDASAAKQDEQTVLLGEIRDNTADISIDADTINLNTDQIEEKLDTIATQQQQDGLTDAELRATPVPISGTVTANTGLTQPTTPADTQPVSGSVVVSNHPTEFPLPASQVTTLTPPAAISGFATSAKQDSLLAELQQKTEPTDVQSTIDVNKQSALPYSQVLTASTTLTPTSGKSIKIVKAQILQSPANEVFNLVTLNFASIGNFFTVWAGSDSNEWIGDVDEVLNITLANANPVSVNIRYKEN